MSERVAEQDPPRPTPLSRSVAAKFFINKIYIYVLYIYILYIKKLFLTRNRAGAGGTKKGKPGSGEDYYLGGQAEPNKWGGGGKKKKVTFSKFINIYI